MLGTESSLCGMTSVTVITDRCEGIAVGVVGESLERVNPVVLIGKGVMVK